MQLTADMKLKLMALSLCTFRVGGWEKRFVHNLNAEPEGTEISERQAAYIDDLYWHYRLQIKHKRSAGYDFPEPVKPAVDPRSVAGKAPNPPKPDAVMTRREQKIYEKQEQLAEWNRKVNGEAKEKESK